MHRRKEVTDVSVPEPVRWYRRISLMNDIHKYVWQYDGVAAGQRVHICDGLISTNALDSWFWRHVTCQTCLQMLDVATPAATSAPASELANSDKKNPHAVALGQLGGAKGGHARAAALSAERRSEISRLAAQTRWTRHP